MDRSQKVRWKRDRKTEEVGSRDRNDLEEGWKEFMKRMKIKKKEKRHMER